MMTGGGTAGLQGRDRVEGVVMSGGRGGGDRTGDVWRGRDRMKKNITSIL